MIYLDHNATTPLDDAVLDAMLPYLREHHGNPSSVHAAGQTARRGVDRARRQVAQLCGASERDVTFTSGGSEADNLALAGVMAGATRRRHLVVSAIEHPAVLEAAAALEASGSARVTRVPPSALGVIEPDALRACIDDDTALVSVMLANNDVGTVQPVAELAAIAHERGALVHCDAVQGAGKVALDVGRLGVDLLSLSAHKIYGPKGVGALVTRPGVAFEPQVRGGGQEMRRRAGTENVAGIVGFGAAAELARARLADDAPRIVALRDQLEQALAARIDDVMFHGDRQRRLGNTASCGFGGVPGEALLMNLDLAGICVSVGSACASGKREPSHVLQAMGVSAADALSTLRFSLGRATTARDIEAVVEALAPVVARLRAQRAVS